MLVSVLLRVSLATIQGALVLATPLSRRWSDFELKHSWVDIPEGWEVHGDPPENHKIDMRVGLKQGKFEELVEHLYQVSDPFHERYGAHLSKAEVEELVAPRNDSIDIVEKWLAHHGIDSESIQWSNPGNSIAISVTVSQAERMLNTKYKVYHNVNSDSYIVRATEYYLPRSLLPHVTVVSPTTYFGLSRPSKFTVISQPDVKSLTDKEANSQVQSLALRGLPAVPSSCSTKTTPACLRALYNTTSYTPQAIATNQIGIVGFLGHYANASDLQMFLKEFRPDAVGATFQEVEVNGGANNQSIAIDDSEGNLDIQYSVAMTFPTPNIYYSTGGSPPFIPDSNTPTNRNEPYLDWLDFILNQTTIPQTFSISYSEYEQTVPLDYATEVCNLFAQLGARGSSILMSSGDNGVGNKPCLSNGGTNTTRFQPYFPPSCPFVTAVGATNKINPEVAEFFSGGGFSNYFARPTYQSSAVTTFLTGLGMENKGLYNTTGRAYPDVSAQAYNFQFVYNGVTTFTDGTSASCPAFAGVIGLLNDFRITSGKAPLGFLNPLLYSSGTYGINDITSGSNPGCGTNGFSAGKGWDPVTGLGTSDFGRLQTIVAEL